MKYIIYTVFIFLFVVECHSQYTLPQDVVESINKRIEIGLNPSIAIGVINKTGTYYFNFGKTKENGTPVNEHTIYEIGSITKTFTAILLAQQEIEGKLKIDDPIKNYLPAEVKVPQKGKTEITFKHLSNHTSGLPNIPTNFSPFNIDNPYVHYTVNQMYSFLSTYELPREIGISFEYSNVAQGLLGHILALNAKCSYEELMLKVIANPLGMKETKIHFDEKMKKNLAIPHRDGEEVSNWDIPTFAGAGAIRSSTFDMLKFLNTNMELKKTVLTNAIKKTHEVTFEKPNKTRIGLGWLIVKGAKGDIICHDGETGGYKAFVGFVKEDSIGVVLFTNSAENIHDIAFHLLDSSKSLQQVKKSLSIEIRRIINKKDVHKLIEFFNDVKQKNNLHEYNFNETSLNFLAYSFVEKNIEVALVIFKFIIELYPTSYSVYDSYGEALLKNGQKELAIENYKKSIELNPENINGIKILKELGVEISTTKK